MALAVASHTHLRCININLVDVTGKDGWVAKTAVER